MLGVVPVWAVEGTAKNAATIPGPLADIGIDQRLGESLPLGLTFRDEMGRTVRLGDYFGERPVVLSLVYYECPMLCTLVLNGLTGALETINLEPGRDYEVVTVSIDPGESFPLAVAKKKEYVKRLGRPAAETSWHFLTGDEENIKKLAAAVGFRYAYDPKTDLFIHAAGIMVATPDGRLARYLYGVEYAPRDLRLSLVEASEGRLGTLSDQVLLFCYQYDPHSGTYSVAALSLVRGGGILTVVLIAGFVTLMLRREKAARRRAAAQARP